MSKKKRTGTLDDLDREIILIFGVEYVIEVQDKPWTEEHGFCDGYVDDDRHAIVLSRNPERDIRSVIKEEVKHILGALFGNANWLDEWSPSVKQISPHTLVKIESVMESQVERDNRELYHKIIDLP